MVTGSNVKAMLGDIINRLPRQAANPTPRRNVTIYRSPSAISERVGFALSDENIRNAIMWQKHFHRNIHKFCSRLAPHMRLLSSSSPIRHVTHSDNAVPGQLRARYASL
jgi:hypothetical protein